MNRLRVSGAGVGNVTYMAEDPLTIPEWLWMVGSVFELSVDPEWKLWIRKMVIIPASVMRGLEYYYDFRNSGDYKIAFYAGDRGDLTVASYKNGIEASVWRYEEWERRAANPERLAELAYEEMQRLL